MVTPTGVMGGAEEVFANLLACLPANGVEPLALSLAHGPLIDRLIAQGVQVTVLDAGRLRHAHRFALTVARLARWLRQVRADAIYSNMPKAHLYCGPAAALSGVAAVWCQAGCPEPPAALDRIATVVPARVVVAPSREAVAAQRRLSRRRRVELVHPGIDLQRFQARSDERLRAEHGIPIQAPLVSIVGRLQPWKGQREFPRACSLALARHPDARFAVVGGAILGWEGDYPQQLQRLAGDLGLADRVIFTGHTAEAHRWMAASDVVVNASDPEPFGLVIIEAMACGCPVVALDRGGPRDIIQHDVNGVLCASREPAELAGAINALLEAPARRQRIGTAARSRVVERFSRERMAARFAEVLRQSLAIPARQGDAR